MGSTGMFGVATAGSVKKGADQALQNVEHSLMVGLLDLKVLAAFSSSDDSLTPCGSHPSTTPKAHPAPDLVCAERKVKFL